MPVREATPSEVKSAISGYGAADKEQVQRMVQLVLGLSEPPTPDDAADALAVAVWVGEHGADGRARGGAPGFAVARPIGDRPARPWRLPVRSRRARGAGPRTRSEAGATGGSRVPGLMTMVCHGAALSHLLARRRPFVHC